jgi:hypothetical protein
LRKLNFLPKHNYESKRGEGGKKWQIAPELQCMNIGGKIVFFALANDGSYKQEIKSEFLFSPHSLTHMRWEFFLERGMSNLPVN